MESIRLRSLWWLHPAALFAAMIGATMLAAAMQASSVYQLYGTPKYIRNEHLLLTLVAIVFFAVACRLGTGTARPREIDPVDVTPILRGAFWITAALTLFGYVVWLAIGIKNGFRPDTLLQLLRGDDPTLSEIIRSEMFVNIKGITTCTQFGIVAVLLGTWLAVHGDRKARVAVGGLLVIAAARALVFSERLALIELLVPTSVLLIRAMVLERAWSIRSRVALQAFPVLGVVMMLVMFGGFEYFRSWQHYKHEFSSYPEFVVWRVGGYYTTAHNNGAMALETQSPYPLPFTTLRHFWLFPGVPKSPIGYEAVTGVNPESRHATMLARYGTEELNNEGGLFQPALDYGIVGYALFWGLCGFVCGRFYRGYMSGSPGGLLVYPLLFLAILETPRFLYLTYPRTFPALVALAVVLWLVQRSPAPVPITQPAQAIS